jgi:hypothetical protein
VTSTLTMLTNEQGEYHLGTSDQSDHSTSLLSILGGRVSIFHRSLVLNLSN